MCLCITFAYVYVYADAYVYVHIRIHIQEDECMYFFLWYDDLSASGLYYTTQRSYIRALGQVPWRMDHTAKVGAKVKAWAKPKAKAKVGCRGFGISGSALATVPAYSSSSIL